MVRGSLQPAGCGIEQLEPVDGRRARRSLPGREDAQGLAVGFPLDRVARLEAVLVGEVFWERYLELGRNLTHVLTVVRTIRRRYSGRSLVG